MSKYTLTIEGNFEKGDCYSCPLAFNAEDTYGDSVSLCSQMVSYEDCPLEEVEKNEWIISSDGYYPYCSKCGHRPGKMSRFCPSCGADMRGGKK